ncbi:vasopressin V1b receptor-like [Dreissena polymorpha]|uniref:vasopressin V1b receptor-like n=1 Tax=Dreissena polymorpha TaxID=45954 RepID=UPI002264F06C|nr:vasopressin V1b receptor-like [Dreissena polymorpha]
MSNISEMTANGTIELDLDTLNQLATKENLPKLVFLVTVMLIGLVGNICVVLVYKLKFKRSSARVYIISLALTDMSVCSVGILYHFYDLTNSITYENVLTCKILSFIISLCSLSSIFILLVVGLDRYLKVCRPLKKQIVDFGDRKACIIATLLAGLFSVPYLAIYGHRTVPLSYGGFNISGSECSIDDVYIEASDSYLGVAFLGFNLILFVSAILYLIIIYGLICHTIRRNYNFNAFHSKSTTKSCCFKSGREDTTNTDTADADLSVEHGTNQEELTPESVKTISECVTANQTVSEIACPNQITQIHDETGKKIVRRTLSNTMIRHTGKGTHVKERNSFKITMMMLTITVVFIVTYLPFISVSILDGMDADFWKGLSKTQIRLFEWLLRIYVLNNAINPFIYCFWDAKFRQEIGNVFHALCQCNSKT